MKTVSKTVSGIENSVRNRFFHYTANVARPPRTDVGGYPYHILNRANARMTIFGTDSEYHAFEIVLAEAQRRTQMPILAYCVMPNHWHLVLYPPHDGLLVPFVRWLTVTHTKRWHAAHKTTGSGHLYQGRYKSFLIETDTHLLTVLRYVERNPLRARLVARTEDWRWSSLWRRVRGTPRDRTLLTSWPVPAGEDYLAWVNAPESKNDLAAIRQSVIRGSPYGNAEWAERVTEQFRLTSTLRAPGRPRLEHGSLQ